MNFKTKLKLLDKLIPNIWLYQMQYIHSSLLVQWILRWGSKPLAFSQKSAMVFSPHQDDETFGCGGMIAMKREHGIPVVVVFLTDGQGSGSSKPHSQEKISQTRKREAMTALEILGVSPSEIYFLEKPDGTLQDLKNEERQQIIKQVAKLLKYYKSEEVYVPHHKDCHKDHEATYKLIQEAIAQSEIKIDLLQYPIWLFWRAPIFILLKLQDIAAAHYLPITSVQDKKNKAIASYISQTQSLPRGFIKQFLGTREIFFKAES
ncbi:PIG-L family deacetylase [Komarekiella sp. 'clone 1']|uniref:PIG-L family deacetylase n=1 Tax=Komarekiella delphini-convector SJRDD-AB1 TaxID=2593771 RepID=A0AA40SSY0_9NOST|nr:PIG-L family deacetylase [Komarekiella delphini-convector]MBD6614407.1 PIG-L family deacetylase [Komarekiella delphini-convector SJRDD-AB1]